MKKIAIICTGNGSNFQAIIDAIKSKKLDIKIVCLIVNNKNAFAIERAKKENICYIICEKNNLSRFEYSKKLASILNDFNLDLICLAGFMIILDKIFFTIYNEKFKNKVLNIHPALLPKYGGKGMYGIHVHNAVFNANEKESGATVHLVNEECDAGQIILQEKISILDCKNSEEIAKKVLNLEHKIYIKAIKKVLNLEHNLNII